MSPLQRPRNTSLKLFSFMSLWLVCAFGYLFLNEGLMYVLVGPDAIQQMQSNTDMVRENRTWLAIFQMGYSLCAFLLPAFIFGAVQKMNISRFYRLNHAPPFTLLMLGMAAIVFAVPFLVTAHELNLKLPLPGGLSELQEGQDEMLNALLEMDSFTDLLVNVMLMAVVPAIAEEVFFRGGLQRLFRLSTGNADMAIITAAGIFSAIHMQFSGFLPRFILGILFGYMFYWSRNLWIPIVVHAFFNGFQVVLYYLTSREGSGFQIDDTESMPFWVSLISVLLMFLILRQFYDRAVLRQELRL